MPLSAVIVDDEQLARDELAYLLKNIGDVNVVAQGKNGLEGVNLIREHNPDLVFLDIQMPKITGLDFFKTLQNAPPVIFTTAFPQYALEGFEVNALDYLVKPISFERFLKAALKAKEYYEVREKNVSEASSTADYFFIKADNKLVKIFFDDVLFVEALQNYVTIHTKDKKFITYLTFKSVEDYLPADKFIKVLLI
jgi:DNA-binding LytR/AlgR family response regulator